LNFYERQEKTLTDELVKSILDVGDMQNDEVPLSEVGDTKTQKGKTSGDKISGGSDVDITGKDVNINDVDNESLGLSGESTAQTMEV
jgi:hypothetical protein